MKKRLFGILLALCVAFTAAASDAHAAEVEYGWEGMEGDIAIRFTQDGAETTRLVVGETYSIQFWLANIDPYAITLPLSWNPSIVTVIDRQTGEPIASGKKSEGEKTGFRAGSKCYESDYDIWTYEPLYWNGRPVYTSDEVGEGGYPYLNAEEGHYRFFYYDRSPNMPLDSQLFLEVFFRVEEKGDPDFHFATYRDGGDRYDPASEGGLTVILPDGDEGTETKTYTKVKAPEIKVMTPEEYKNEATTPVDPDQKFPYDPSDYNPGNPFGQTEIDVRVKLEKAEHLGCFPYTTAVETNTVVRNIKGKVTLESDYILPKNKISAAVNDKNPGARSLLALMPDRMVPKDEYSVVFSMNNIDDMAASGLSMLYFETPLGYIGFNTAALSAQTRDDSECRLTVNKFGVDGGMKIEFFVDGEAVKSFDGGTMRVIMPYDAQNAPLINSADDEAVPAEGEEDTRPRMYGAMMGQDMFKQGNYDGYPMGLHYYDEEAKCIIFLTGVLGNYYVSPRVPGGFDDMASAPWAVESVDRLSERGIITGTGNGVFEPNGRVTRGQFATMLVRAFGLYTPMGESPFSDVPADNFYAPFIAAAKKAQAVNGTSETTYEPDAGISRQDLCVIVYRTLTQLGVNMTPVRNAEAFADDASIAPYAREAVYRLYMAGIINGTGEGRFEPLGTTTRAEAAKILWGVLEQAQKLL